MLRLSNNSADITSRVIFLAYKKKLNTNTHYTSSCIYILQLRKVLKLLFWKKHQHNMWVKKSFKITDKCKNIIFFWIYQPLCASLEQNSIVPLWRNFGSAFSAVCTPLERNKWTRPKSAK